MLTWKPWACRACIYFRYFLFLCLSPYMPIELAKLSSICIIVTTVENVYKQAVTYYNELALSTMFYKSQFRIFLSVTPSTHSLLE